jgi:hypothetical protein
VHHSLSVGPAQHTPDCRIHALKTLLIEPSHEGAIARMKQRSERFIVQIQWLVGKYDRGWQGRNHRRLTIDAASLDEIIVGGAQARPSGAKLDGGRLRAGRGLGSVVNEIRFD